MKAKPGIGHLASIKVLEPYFGTWEKEWINYPSVWSPKKSKESGSHTWEKISDKNQLSETGRDASGSTYRSTWSFDDSTGELQISTSQSDGNSLVMNGKWDSDSNTISVEGDWGDGIKMNSIYRFIDENSFEFSVTAKDKAGEIYLRLEGTGKRKKP